MGRLHQMDEGHVDEVLRHGVLNLFDEPNRLVTVEQCARHLLRASGSIERYQGAEVGPKPVGGDVDASADRASEDPTVWSHDQPFTLPSEENDRAVCGGAASGAPGTAGMTFDLSGQRLER